MLCADVVHRTSDLINSLRCFRDNRKELSYIKKHLLGVMDVQSVQIYGYLYIFGDALLSL